ncbi:MAG: TlpA family protein disulfide reductase [Verrucomicrobiae bacterium]|nr:TlpA family protein disulfide reductase [Verrucomicrobiae bacterium]
MKSRPFFFAATSAALFTFVSSVSAQEQSASDAAALKVLEDAFSFYEKTPVQFLVSTTVTQEMGEMKKDMVVPQQITVTPTAFATVGAAADFPMPAVHISEGKATVVFEKEKSYIELDGVKGVKGAFESAELGYDETMNENSLLGATAGAAIFEKLLGAGADGRKTLVSGLKLVGEKVVAGTAGHHLSGNVKANPIGLPIENAVVPFEMVIAKGDTPMLLSYTPDNTALIADFVKTRPQLGALKVSMDCAFTDWKTGGSIDQAPLKLPDFADFKKYGSIQELAAAMQEGAGGNAAELKGKPAPEIELATVDGGTFKLSDEKGKSVVILDFWATWCGPCVQAMPIIEKVAKSFEAKGVKFVAVNLNETPAEVKDFMEKHKLSPLVIMDTEGTVAQQYMVVSIPQTVIVGKDGNVAEVHVGLSPSLEKDLTAELEALVK